MRVCECVRACTANQTETDSRGAPAWTDLRGRASSNGRSRDFIYWEGAPVKTPPAAGVVAAGVPVGAGCCAAAAAAASLLCSLLHRRFRWCQSDTQPS